MHGQASPGQVLCYNEAVVWDFIAKQEFASALEMLIQQYQDAIVRYCRCHIAEADKAQEIAQDVFLAVLEAMPRFRGQSSLKTWLYGIAVKKCLEAGRNGSRREHIARDNWRLIKQGAHCDPPQGPEEVWHQVHERQLVWQALHALRAQDRELVVLRYLEELTYDEIAQVLQLSKRTIERRLPVAQAKFHKAYERCQNKAMLSRHNLHGNGSTRP
ncbi:MAG: RNA polymerase sigma factor [Candidatus Tectimicrobiota bacterium]